MIIPRLPLLTHPQIAPLAPRIRARRIQNRPVTLNDLWAAFIEALFRVGLKICFVVPIGGIAVVTYQEVMDAVVRCDAVFNAYGVQVYPAAVAGGNGVAAALNAINNNINNLRNNLTNNINNLRNNLNNNINLLRNDVNKNHAELSAKIVNIEKKRRNYEMQHAPRCLNPYLIPLVKEVRGFGRGLPGYPVNRNTLPRNAPRAVGAPIPNRLFPTLAQLPRLSHRRLSVLSAIYNDDFGIVAADNLETRREKFRQFIS